MAVNATWPRRPARKTTPKPRCPGARAPPTPAIGRNGLNPCGPHRAANRCRQSPAGPCRDPPPGPCGPSRGIRSPGSGRPQRTAFAISRLTAQRSAARCDRLYPGLRRVDSFAGHKAVESPATRPCEWSPSGHIGLNGKITERGARDTWAWGKIFRDSGTATRSPPS